MIFILNIISIWFAFHFIGTSLNTVSDFTLLLIGRATAYLNKTPRSHDESSLDDRSATVRTLLV